MLTQDVFEEHKKDYTIYKKAPVLDQYHNETNAFAPGGTIHCMWTPIIDDASIAEYGETVNSMMQAVLYDNTAIDPHDQVVIDGDTYEFVSIKKYPSYRLAQVKKL